MQAISEENLKEIDSLTKEIEEVSAKKQDLFVELGKVTYDKSITDKQKVVSELERKLEDIDSLVKKNEDKILLLRGYKKCSCCGNEEAIDVRYCGSCGEKFEDITEALDECKVCGTKIVFGNKFCLVCGNALGFVSVSDKKCPNCGKILRPNVKFCTECGSAI